MIIRVGGGLSAPYILAWCIYYLLFQRTQEFSKTLKIAEKGKEAIVSRRA